MVRYFAGFILTVGLIVLVVILLFGGSSKPKTPITNKVLWSYSGTDAEARLTIDGATNADSLHQQVRITVGRDNVSYEQIRGYNGDVVNQQNFSNSEEAYDAFLHAVARAGFTKGDTSSALQDEQGYCPLGDRYIFEFRQGDKQIERFWTTGCGGTHTYRGNRDLTITLFQRQVPDYDKLTAGLTL